MGSPDLSGESQRAFGRPYRRPAVRPPVGAARLVATALKSTVVAAGLASALVYSACAPAPPPNVIWVSWDSVRADQRGMSEELRASLRELGYIP